MFILNGVYMIQTWDVVSKHRSELMLLSILWVIGFHFSTPPYLTIQDTLISIGCSGVDFFMFLSGFGLCYNYYNKINFNVFDFYKRRFIKILPTYYMCIIVFGLITGLSIVDLAWQMSCVGFWIGKSYYDWYVPSILLLYLIFPFFVMYAKKFGIGRMAVIASFIGMIPTVMFIYLMKGTPILFTARIPIFFIGCYAGYMLANKKTIRYPILLIAVSIITFVSEIYIAGIYDYQFMHRTGLYYIPLMFVVPGACLLLSALLEFIPNKILVPFRWLGAMTLEIYLVHMSLRTIYPKSKYLLPIIIAIILHYTVKYATNFINQTRGGR